MNSNAGNSGREAAGENPAEMNEPERNEMDDGTPIEIHVTDRRRVSIDQEIEAEPVDDPAPVTEDLEARLREAEEKRAEAERQVRDLADRFRHAQNQLKTEAEEQRARMQRMFDQKLEAARGEIVAGLLDTLDNLKRAVAAAEKSESKEPDFAALLEGVRATAGLFETKMQSMGLKPVPGIGEIFDPEVHEAVEIVPVPEDQDNRVIQEYQTGYKFGERLIRPARVRVGRA